MGLLDGLRVLEWGRQVSAPYCSRLLADLGADVIKVEVPEGDPARREPPFIDDVPSLEGSGLFQYLNASKRGITLDPASAEGRNMLGHLLETADVFVENQPPELVRRLLLDEDALRAHYPGLIVASIRPFGDSGPYRDFRSAPITSWAAGGFSYLTPRYAEAASVPPLQVAGRQPEYIAGANAAAGVLCALLWRDESGEGQHVDVSEQEGLIGVLHSALTRFTYQQQTPTRVSAHMGAPNEAHPCSDGYIHLQCTEEHQWRRFVELMGTPDWAELPTFATGPERGQNFDALSALAEEWTRQYTKRELHALAAAARLPFAPLLTIEELVADPQVLHRHAVLSAGDPQTGNATMPGSPFRLSGGTRPPNAAPTLGQHNAEVMSELGLNPGEVAADQPHGVA